MSDDRDIAALLSRAIRQKIGTALTRGETLQAFIVPYADLERVKLTSTADIDSLLSKASRVTEDEAVNNFEVVYRDAVENNKTTIVMYGDLNVAAIIPPSIHELTSKAQSILLPGERLYSWDEIMVQHKPKN